MSWPADTGPVLPVDGARPPARAEPLHRARATYMLDRVDVVGQCGARIDAMLDLATTVNTGAYGNIFLR